MSFSKLRIKKRARKKISIRSKLFGTADRPRLSVFRSDKNTYAQIIDDSSQKTLCSYSTIDKEYKKDAASLDKKQAAKEVGQKVAKKAIEKGIKEVVFDRNGYLYHGRVKELADGARSEGLSF